MAKLYKNKIRLDSPKKVRLLLARAVNRFNKDIIDYKDLRAIGYIGGKLIDSFKLVDMEERLEELEKLLDN